VINIQYCFKDLLFTALGADKKIFAVNKYSSPKYKYKYKYLWFKYEYKYKYLWFKYEYKYKYLDLVLEYQVLQLY